MHPQESLLRTIEAVNREEVPVFTQNAHGAQLHRDSAVHSTFCRTGLVTLMSPLLPSGAINQHLQTPDRYPGCLDYDQRSTSRGSSSLSLMHLSLHRFLPSSVFHQTGMKFEPAALVSSRYLAELSISSFEDSSHSLGLPPSPIHILPKYRYARQSDGSVLASIGSSNHELLSRIPPKDNELPSDGTRQVDVLHF
ncbi:uncharacterized protein FOMMEDRAFT_151076 [Fomitiporia mediterranea MF3/22]|uniref:uncharacterized protein n=1 Tax=Fomitiporia mediterranea (strain MF3/22) TaxID=694068 RepID=UPI0004409781|nr:uncharacterized protein FOMMEDRAFT_151076 [Fomitiporia mediterranea MF3/22]EJD08313.1 hypothetical protein FOMMEDRAFT_151076 [Fomitiporia mediterranea MF3/22]